MKTKIINLYKKIAILFAAMAVILPNISFADQINLPKDANGWTIFTPSADTRIMYVSESGNDSTGQVYSKNSPEVGSDPRKPTGNIHPFKTYAAAYAHSRNNYPDWVLFKRGDSFSEAIDRNIRSGRSETEPSLIADYGNSGDIPVFNIPQGAYGVDGVNPLHNAVVANIKFYSYTRDPDNPGYVKPLNGKDADGHELDYGGGGFRYRGGDLNGLLIEGCEFKFANIGFISRNDVPTYLFNVTIRRSIIRNVYNTSTHAIGLWASNVKGLNIEENIFYHNGWLIKSPDPQHNAPDDGQATWFNHNIYATVLSDVKIVDNVFTLGSSSSVKLTAHNPHPSHNIIVSGNLMLTGGESGLNIGNNYPDVGRFSDIHIFDNIIADTNLEMQTARPTGLIARINGWSNGEFRHNLIMSKPHSGVCDGIELGDKADGSYDQGLKMENVDISDNILTDLTNCRFIRIKTDGNPAPIANNVTVRNNKIKATPLSPEYIIDSDHLNGFTWENNVYDGEDKFYFNGGNKTFAQWVAATNDTSTRAAITFPDGSRNPQTYMGHIGYASNYNTFYQHILNQKRYSWDTRMTAPVIRDWIFAGYYDSSNIAIRADVDQNSVINSTDAMLTLRNSLGLNMSSTNWHSSATTGDVNCDSSSNSTDAMLILRHSLGLSDGVGWCGN